MRLLNLPDHLRSYGLHVVEVPGWQTRGVEFPDMPEVVVWHHTATSNHAPGDYPTLAIVRDGRPDLKGPLCQVGLGRSGACYVVASGKANHAGKGAWDGVTRSDRTVGIEAESPGDGTWTHAQRDAYPVLGAALTSLLGTTAQRNCAHREWALPHGRKTDPVGWDMDQARREVALHLRSASRTTPAPEEDDMPLSDDDVQKVAKAAAELVRKDIITLLRGDAQHPYNIESIAKAVGVKP